ncbi:P-loop containing nucleoside triphosphate hydrolase protein [Gamsiella multidivaricata]|uniref:P-loop containing nucleoside triphosphate hydrolase protein n=1 Tax=Gamsiella multidivaricata TaxID=101098 RepID=UPI0022210C00|nr:P-loop containing nucleoside triphosphate hydrolase protein [Gamsiella multidivaricata]KAI7821393.1 P-loop containing nucleoside triphosphate hydrolase protein [Gamsiella multidivaricata]
MAYFTIAISIAFFFEALPRHNTRVQRLAREKEYLNDWQQANLFSRLSYHYFQRIVSLGATRPLTGDDLANTAPAYLLTNVNYERVAASWERNKSQSASKNKQPSFFWAVIGAYKRKISIMLIVRLIGYGLLYVPPMLFGQLLRFIDDYSKAVKDGVEPPDLKIGFLISAAMLFFNISSIFMLCQGFQKMTDLGIGARAATIALIYRKSLKLSPQAKQSCTLGEITNHMAVDAERWIDASLFLPLVISVPLELVISICLLYRLLGWSLLAGLAVFAILMPVQGKMASFMNGFQEDQLKWMDSRLRLMTEILTNIKIVKLYHWEGPFRKKLDALRTKELYAIKGLATVQSILTIVFSSVTLLMALFTFWVYAYIGGPNMTPGKITSEVIFVSITLFGIMNKPLGLMALVFSKTIAVKVAMERLKKFLLMEEIDTTVVRRYCRPSLSSHSGAMAVDIEEATFSWEKKLDSTASFKDASQGTEAQPLLASNNSEPDRPNLLSITLRIPDGSLTAIVGRIGQGKSSLLGAIMGEMYKRNGSITVYGELAYVPQQAWIINATVRDNILFGKPFDEDRYNRIIFAAGLKPDLEMLAAGDQTEIGERGINLSGGQKQRVSLARAAYQDADIYLLDDPLSAVDAHVDQHLWQNLIGPEGLLRDKTRLLVTHGIHHLEYMDQIIVLKDGAINEVGEYQQLMKARSAFYQLIKDFSKTRKKARHSSSHKRTLRDLLHGRKDTGADGYGSTASVRSSISQVDSQSDSEGEASERNTIAEEFAAKVDKNDADNDESGELIADEKMEVGRVGWSVMMVYARAASIRNALLCIVLSVLAQACHLGTNFWLRYWISDTQARDSGAEGRPVSYYLIGYGLFVILFMCIDIAVNYTTQVICGIRASKVIYDRLLTRVLRLPMSFFDVTPMGRIVNRFSSDIYNIDLQLAEEWNDLFVFISIIGGTLFVIAYSTPVFLIAVPPLIMTYFWVQHYFIKSSSSLKRLYSVSKSPLYQHFSETLNGVSSIRVMKGLREQFIQQNESRIDILSNRLNAYNFDNRWLQIRLESLGGITVFISASLAVMNAARLDPSLVGLALSYALNMVGFINYLVRTVSEVQNALVSVERVDEYSQKPTEAPIETGARLPQNWPAEGRVVFKNYFTRYREGLDLVIKDASFIVEPSQSVGIVGRTGAGKSSLTLALFRIVEAAGSSIEIDGIDISTLGLKDLRQHLSIIPQDPTLFAGTVRDNLDPFEEHSDKDLWEALERSHLKDHISSLAGGLSYEVAQNGENFSVGQRSLICLARALLRKTKVLVLDEATAAVDVETDELIQKTIRKEFKDRTVLTIAHRIKTVMDSDRILVLDKGRVQEYEAPSELLKRKDSLFYQLAEQAGEI